MVAAPSGNRSIVMAFDCDLDGEKRRRTMVLRPVELNSTGNPGTSEPNERRLDHVLSIEKVVAVPLVESYVDSSADLWQDHQAQILVFKMYCLPCVIACL